MYSPSIVLCFALLLVASLSEFQEDFTNSDEQSDNSTMQSDFLVNSTKNNCKNDSVRYESREHIIKNLEDNNQTSMEFCTNSTEINNFTLPEINETFTKTEDNSISYKYDDSHTTVKTIFVKKEECNDNIACIQLCCNFGYNLTIKGRCIEHLGENKYTLQNMYALPNKQKNDSEDEISDKLFLTVRDPCVEQGYGRQFIYANTYLLLTNGSLYTVTGEFISPKSYCFAIMFRKVYDVIICTGQTKLPVYISACHLLSLPFLLLTFIVYSVLPELRNMHGYALRAHVGSLFITYAIIYPGQQVSGFAELKSCVPLAYILNFFFLASFFWLNVTCFDIWWTFRELRSHRRGGNHYEKKKLIIYSSYAWGVTIILNVICAIVDNIPNPPENLIRPEICEKKFWYGENAAKTYYFYVPVGITIISNVFFFICTTLTILYQKIHTASEMKDSESKRHEENKQRFNMYLKLFIVMGITWVFEILSWVIGTTIVPVFVWYVFDVINSLQGLIIFIVFVWRRKIKQMLLKQFGGKTFGPFKIPMSDSVTSNTTTATSLSSGSTISMQQISPSN
ncbi:PREDICTED: G-protein coupled receptor Mth2-like [Trachymyrmex septentrionalis]|uniref:G-protein coupled receptor Mth2-like n=1 Tax=Trachymyrmex septentrionalis TaxID=34720 RepID=UPI00084F1C50|nr:PREDICTED: G-protein coupled receptor Mth2-like [Trachymyrmex septentrionalis]XP_018352127.1 PREDICTED: G-protein coupled receptor Mth2-like [Trachymyrmex septentrionalis]